MNEQEIDLMDELYFVQSYAEVKRAIDWEDALLQKYLLGLYEKEYVKMLTNHDEEYQGSTKNLDHIPWNELYFLATKKGLLEHNGF
jgi:hypothetical protein